MPTSLHIPAPLLQTVDRLAKSHKISRNRFIVEALKKEVAAARDWSPGFFDQLASQSSDTTEAVDALLFAIKANRKSKGPVVL